MNSDKIFKVLLMPHVTNKTVNITKDNSSVVFKVLPQASKVDIKKSVEMLFKVKVDNIRTINVKGKTRIFKKIKGQTKLWKKAYIKLAKGHTINFIDSE